MQRDFAHTCSVESRTYRVPSVTVQHRDGIQCYGVGFGPLPMRNILHMAGRFGIAHNCTAECYLVVNEVECDKWLPHWRAF